MERRRKRTKKKNYTKLIVHNIQFPWKNFGKSFVSFRTIFFAILKSYSAGFSLFSFEKNIFPDWNSFFKPKARIYSIIHHQPKIRLHITTQKKKGIKKGTRHSRWIPKRLCFVSLYAYKSFSPKNTRQQNKFTFFISNRQRKKTKTRHQKYFNRKKK